MQPGIAPIIGSHQVGFEGARDEGEIQRRTLQMIARALNIGRLIGFVGAGISRAYRYPTWEELTETAIDFTLKEIGPLLDATSRSLLEPESARLKEGRQTTSQLGRPDRILFLLGLCEDECRRRRRQGDFLQQIAQQITGTVPDIPSPDPLRLILERLKIRRFLTTNYDVEIERAFVRVLGCPPRPLGLEEKTPAPLPVAGSWPDWTPAASNEVCVGPRAVRLMLEPGAAVALAQFAVGAPGFERGVFHCHGIAAVPQSMVVTESDYQTMYLQDDPTHRAYRDALSLAFAGNPVLFMGLGMEENDLLRPLRQFVSERQRDPRDRPLFALLERPERELDAIEIRRYLYTRYGVKAFYYPPGPDPTEAFCQAVEELADGWSRWWAAWQRKPAIRRAAFQRVSSSPPTMIHHYWTIPRERLFDHAEDERAVVRALDEGARAVILLGRPGTGKGSVGLGLAAGTLASHIKHARRFYATTHFTNDFLSMVDAAADFLGDGREFWSAPLDRLRRALLEGKHLCVFGGLERLLVPVESKGGDIPEPPTGGVLPLPLGRPATREIESLLELMQEVGRRDASRLVLTSTMRPAGMAGTGVRLVELQGLTEEALRRCPPFDAIAAMNEGLLQRLHHALRGHIYAFSVIRQALSRPRQPGESVRWLRQLVTRLTAVEFHRRAELAMQAALDELLGQPDVNRRHRLTGVLQLIARITTPVSLDAIAPCRCDRTYTPTELDRDIRLLREAGFLIELPAAPDGTPIRYTAHTLARTHVLHALGNLPDVTGEPQHLDFTMFSAEAEELQMESLAGYQMTTRAVDAILAELEGEVGEDHRKRRDLIRTGFGLIRSRWTATGIVRLAALAPETEAGVTRPHYDAYQRRLARLINAIRHGAGEETWYDSQVDALDRVITDGGVLYADELAWLYNELGLVAYCQGSLHDAYALFRMGQDVNGVVERHTVGRRWCQTEMNLALVQIERAHLMRARYHLENAFRAASWLGDLQMAAQAHGYLGLVHHLAGEYKRAEKCYDEALDKIEPSNRRARSIFRRHRGDLRRLLGRLDEAVDDIHDAVSAAESGGHPDLLQYARVAEAYLRLRRGDRLSPEVLLPALDVARRAGIPKLEGDTYKIQGHIALTNGEAEIAARRALDCLNLASGLGMRLRLTAALVFMGQVARKRGDARAARGILRSAAELAERQAYQLQLEAAQRELMELGPSEEEKTFGGYQGPN